MTETSQQYHRPLKPLGMKGDILLRNPARFNKLSDDQPPVLPKGIKGRLARNPNFGKGGAIYENPLHFKTVRTKT